MKTRFTYLWRATCAVMLICIVLLSIMPSALMAQEGSTPLFLPMISGGLGQASTDQDSDPFVGFDQIPENELETVLLAKASRELPEPTALAAPPDNRAAADDWDADGVPNNVDNCPHQPNPSFNGSQPEFCGRALMGKINRFVFLHSRIFPPVEGIDPELKHTQKRERIHVLLHVIPNANGVMLLPQQRLNLQSLGINLLGYLPHNTYLVSLPRNLATVQQIVALENVKGISALRPKDKVSPQFRVQGPTMGRNADGTLSFEVDFFEDVPKDQIEGFLNTAELPFSHQYDNTYHIILKNWQSLRRLVIQDIVYFVDDLPDEIYTETQNAQALINGPVVSNTLGLHGSGIVVSMAEPGLAKPTTRPEINGRVELGNNPIFETAKDEDHAQAVSAIMIADARTNAGLLPEAELVSFSVQGLTRKSQFFGVNEDAHDDYGAVLSNYSSGFLNCSKIGEYHKPGKFMDRAVRDVGIVIVQSAGNGRGPTGDFAQKKNCPVELYSLPHDVAKNDISVGNWDIGTGALNVKSSAGPTADERLKPDLVAPGQGINTIDWDEINLTSVMTTFGGTSAAAPVTSGVVGWLAESFVRQGVLLDSIPPARYKAILIHTAKDVGPAGPDFLHGYGLIQADRALRIAEEWSSWGREGLVDGTTTQVIFEFDVNSPMTFYKATLAWADLEGEYLSTMALQNDLDLTLVSPTGNTFYPYEIVLSGGANNGSVPCLNSPCDQVNNVEMVMVNPTTDFVEQGTWQAVIDTSRLVSDEQNFSLVLTPPCPLELDSSVTLTADIHCIPTMLEPSGILIQNDSIDLNCDNHTINGQDAGVLGFNGAYAGVRVLGNGVTVRNCLIRQFDVGIKVGDVFTRPTNARLINNTFENNGTIAIELVGIDHLAQNNNVAEMLVRNGRGITIDGVGMTLQANEFHLARNSGQNNTTAILVHPLSSVGTISSNTFDGFWENGIRLHTVDKSSPITNFLIDNNTFEGIEKTPIELRGEVSDTVVSNNTISIYGDNLPAINVVAYGSSETEDNVISGNSIVGSSTLSQFGIQIENTNDIEVLNNTLSTVKTGITEKNTTDIVISGNVINPTIPLNNFKTSTGISSTNSDERLAIANNQIRFSTTGIDIFAPFSTEAEVTGNLIQVEGVGVRVANAISPTVSGNGIQARLTAITLQSSPKALINENSINMNGTGTGIVVAAGNDTLVRSNTIAAPTVGIAIGQTEAVSVITNTVLNPAVTGIVLDDDTSAKVDDNLVSNSPLGIHYQAGVDAVLSNNEVNSLAGGTGIRLGTGAAGCPVHVDNILVQDNSLTGVVLGVEVLCDVGTHTLIGN